MKAVNLYVVYTEHGPRRQDGAYGWVLESIRDSGEPDPRTLSGIAIRENTIDRYLVLEAIAEGLGHIRTACDVTVYVSGADRGEGADRCTSKIAAQIVRRIVSYMENGQVEKWEANGWRNAQGEDWEGAGLWRNAVAVLRSTSAVFDENAGRNPYKSWISAEINRALRSKMGDLSILENWEPAEKRNFIKITA